MTTTIDLLIYLSGFIFSIGLGILIARRNAILMLMGIELMLNAANLNLVAFNRRHANAYDGQMFALFVIIVAVCEAAVGLAIVFRVYRYYHTSRPDEISQLKG